MHTKRQLLTGKARMTKLINFLARNPQGNWDMMRYNTCAMSHFPKLFPKFWKKDEHGKPIYYLQKNKGIWERGCRDKHVGEFFSTTDDSPIVNYTSLFANKLTQKEEVELLRDFVREYYDKELKKLTK